MHTWNLPCDRLGILSISSILPQILPQTSSQTQGNSRFSRGKLERNRMEHQTPSVFPGNFRKRKVLGTLCFPFCLPEKLVQAKQLWHKVNDTPSQNCIGSRVRIPQFDSAQKTQTGVVTGSKPTLAFTCYPPVPKPDASPHETPECSFATVYHSLYATVAYPVASYHTK